MMTSCLEGAYINFAICEFYQDNSYGEFFAVSGHVHLVHPASFSAGVQEEQREDSQVPLRSATEAAKPCGHDARCIHSRIAILRCSLASTERDYELEVATDADTG